MTNRHVAGLFAIGLGFRDIRYVAGDAAVNFDRFKREEGDPPEDQAAALQVREVLMIHPYWDMALLRVDNGLTSLPHAAPRSRPAIPGSSSTRRWQ